MATMCGKTIDPQGNIAWYDRGAWHREDGPAIIRRDGTTCWYLNGVCHREDGPARIIYDGARSWYYKGDRADTYARFQELSGCSDAEIIILALKWGKMAGNYWGKMTGNY